MFSHQNRLTNDRSTQKMNTQYNAKIENGITRVPLKPRCNPTSPRGLTPTSPRQSDPKCQAGFEIFNIILFLKQAIKFQDNRNPHRYH